MAKEGPGQMDVKIGDHLRQLRLKAGFSQVRVAQVLGISQQLVDRQERGGCRLSVAQLLRLAALYGRTLAQLMVELALDHSAPLKVSEPETALYDAGAPTRDAGGDFGGDFGREPFLLNLAQLRDRAERQAVLDLFNRFAAAQKG